MVRGYVYLPEKLAKVEPHLCRLNSFEFVALFSLDLSRTPQKCHTKWTENVQRTNSTEANLTINSEKTHAKHNDEKDTYKSARKTMGVVKVIRRRGDPKVKYLFQSKIKPSKTKCIVLKSKSLNAISLLSTKGVGNFLVLMLDRRFNKEGSQP